MAADSILVHPSTVTGSIGVIMLTVNARGLLEKVGVEANAITSGPRKDMGSPFRVMTAEERGIFQSVIDSFYLRFLAVVQEGRPNLSADQIKKLADGRIYSGDQAKAAGLIDEIGYLSYDARAADLLFQVVSRRYERRSLVLTTNLPFSEWPTIFPNAATATALIDRVVHHAEIITIEGDSYRRRVAEAKHKAARAPAAH